MMKDNMIIEAISSKKEDIAAAVCAASNGDSIKCGSVIVPVKK